MLAGHSFLGLPLLPDALTRAASAAGVAGELSCSVVAWEMEGIQSSALSAELRVDDKIMLGGTERYGGFFDIPADDPRGLIVANTAMFTTLAELDRFVAALRQISRQGLG